MAVAPDGRAAFDLVSTQVAPAERRGTPTVQVGRDCPAGQICALGATVDSVDSARTAYRKTVGVAITICAPADPQPCNRLKESA
jgi:hypothetical protein